MQTQEPATSGGGENMFDLLQRMATQLQSQQQQSSAPIQSVPPQQQMHLYNQPQPQQYSQWPPPQQPILPQTHVPHQQVQDPHAGVLPPNIGFQQQLAVLSALVTQASQYSAQLQSYPAQPLWQNPFQPTLLSNNSHGAIPSGLEQLAALCSDKISKELKVPSRQKPKVKDHRGTRASAVVDTPANSVKAESDDDEETEGVDAIAGAEGEEEHNKDSGKVKELEETSEVEESDESEDEGDDTDYESPSKNRSGDGKEQSPHIVTDTPSSAQTTSKTANDHQESSTPDESGRIVTVMERWNNEKSKWEDVPFELEKGSTIRDQAAAVFRRQMDIDNDKKLISEEIEIHSPELKLLLKNHTSPWWRDMITDSDQPHMVQSPFYGFVWHWGDYKKACVAQETDTPAQKQARNDLNDLLDLIKTSSALKAYFRSRELTGSSEKIRFEYLWTLFGHGEKVCARSYMNELQMFEVKNCSNPGYDKRFWVSCSAFDWDGTKFSTYVYDFYIKDFSGEKPINDLDIYPVNYYKTETGVNGRDQLYEQLTKRGQKYVELCTQEPSMFQCEYQGTALVTPSALHRLTSKGRGQGYASDSPYVEDEVEVASIEITGKQSRVIVDNLSFMKSARNTMKRGDTPPLGTKASFIERGCVCGICKDSVIHTWKPSSTLNQSLKDIGQEFTEEQKRLQFLPPRLLGYALKEKVWGQFLVDKLEPISSTVDKDKSGPFWTELELEQEAKRHLMAFVQHHRASGLRKTGPGDASVDAKAFDIIEGKGQGLVILLHGPPGVGKTLTAETIALATGRPLLTISVAEIGIDYQQTEKNLTDVFVDAARWEAVLLMDEAEVFVEQRDNQDMARNAQVSVMLRCLEYFEGIVIMTTNRVKAIDVAIQSRVQLAIRYHDLNPTQRLAIYLNRLKYIPDDEFKDREALIRSLKTSPLIKLRPSEDPPNGRQIRNIVTYARALAKSEGKPLTIEHLLSVADTTSTFTDSMKDLTRRQRERSEVNYDEQR